MEYAEAVMENVEFSKAMGAITKQLNAAAHLRPNQLRFKLALLEHLTVQLLGHEDSIIPRSASERNDLTDGLSVIQFMDRIKPQLQVLSQEERLIIVATLAFTLSQEILPEMIDRYAAALSIA